MTVLPPTAGTAGEGLLTAAPPASAPRRGLLRLLLRDRSALLGGLLLLAIVLAVAFAPLLTSHSPYDANVARRLAPPSRTFPLGTDELGRDELARLLYGGRTSLTAAIAATALVTVIGLSLGLLAGYRGGALDMLIGRVIDVLLSFPSFLLALAITAVLGRGLRNVVLAVVISSWAGFARLVRSAILAEQRRPYVEAARELGGTSRHIVFRHLLPNIMGPVSVFVALEVGAMLGILSAFSFLGLGIMPPFPEWGSMLAEARDYVTVAPHMILAPGMAIFLVVLGCSLAGDRLRDLLDPRTTTTRS